MKKIINILCIILMVGSLTCGYFVVTNNSSSNDNKQMQGNGPGGNMGTPPDKPGENSSSDSDNSTTSDSTSNDETTTSSDNNNQMTPPDMNNSSNMPQDMNQNNSNSLSTNQVVLLGICELVFILSAVELVVNNKKKILNKDQKTILILGSLIISFALTFTTVCLLNKFYYNNNKNDMKVENSNQDVTTNGVLEVDSTKEEDSKTYESTEEDVSSIVVKKGGNYTLTNATIKKSGDSSNVENSEFYGLNAGILAKNGGILTLKNSKITTNSKGSNALFATGEGSKITVSDTEIQTYSDSSRGLDATYSGEIEAENMTIHTRGQSSATLATDRGEGTVTVSNSTLKTEGKGSPIIYSTGNITLTDSKGTSTNSQAVVVEGKNSANIKNTTITTSGIGNRNNVDNAGVMIYQSMSGDANEGKGTFTSKNSKITIDSSSSVYKTAPMFFITNTEAEINLENTTLNYGSNILLDIEGTSEWGNSGSNGADVILNAINQTLKGNITVDKLSTLELNLEKSTYKGTINTNKTAKKITLKLDKSSKITLTGDSYIDSLDDEDTSYSNIDFNGYKLYVNGKSIN